MLSRDEAGARRRGFASAVLAVAAVLLTIMALLLSYAGRALLRSEPFADRTVAALHDPSVQAYVADRVTDAVVQSGTGDLVVVRPIVRSLAGGIVGGAAFAALLRRAMLDAHLAVLEHDQPTLRVRMSDVGTLVQGVLQRFAPGPARTIGAERLTTLLTLRPSDGLLGVVRTARRVYSLAWLVLLLAVAAATGALWISSRRRRTAQQLGLGMALGAMTVVALLTVGRAVAEQAASSDHGAVVGALWGSFLNGLRVQALLLAAAGAICAAVAGRVRLAKAGMPGEGASTRARVAWNAALIVAGVAILLEPAALLNVAALALGLYVLAAGAAGVLDVMALDPAAVTNPSRPRLRNVRRLAAPVVALAAAAAILVVIASGGGDEAPAVTPITCNGHVALCNRPLNDVAFAATHNSMGSVTLPNFLFGQQDGTIADQLAYGVHGLLIDTYYGTAFPGGVRTDLERLPKTDVAVRELGAPAVDAALRIRSRLGSGGAGTPGIFLCHGFCEIGAVPLASALADLRSFLVSHPGEIVIVINQDEGVSPTDIERAFGTAGLLDLVYRGPLGPFPTLRSMIDSNQRLVVLAENDTGNIPWYHPAYEHALQETPFRFTTPGQLTDSAKLAASCSENRGTDSAPLFLLNHWVDTTPAPRPSLAEIVNSRSALLTRAQACMRIRRRLPNLVAVDFFRRGDLLGVVDALNRLTP
jgi:hypothetical protein